MVSLPTTIPLTLPLRLASSIADCISRSLRSVFLSIQAPTVTLRQTSLATRRPPCHPTAPGVTHDTARPRSQCLQVGADFFGARNIIDVGMSRSFERSIGHARQDAFEVGCLLLLPQYPPHGSVNGGHKQ